jgi:hypothetical protein
MRGGWVVVSVVAFGQVKLEVNECSIAKWIQGLDIRLKVSQEV